MRGETGEDSPHVHGDTNHRANCPDQRESTKPFAKRSFLHETVCDSACIMHSEWSMVSCVKDWGWDCLWSETESDSRFTSIGTATMDA